MASRRCREFRNALRKRRRKGGWSGSAPAPSMISGRRSSGWLHQRMDPVQCIRKPRPGNLHRQLTAAGEAAVSGLDRSWRAPGDVRHADRLCAAGRLHRRQFVLFFRQAFLSSAASSADAGSPAWLYLFFVRGSHAKPAGTHAGLLRSCSRSLSPSSSCCWAVPRHRALPRCGCSAPCRFRSHWLSAPTCSGARSWPSTSVRCSRRGCSPPWVTGLVPDSARSRRSLRRWPSASS